MKFGLFGIGSGACAEPEIAARVACAAEDVGFESLWTGEHVVLPDPQAPPSPAPPDFPMLHPSVALAYVAAVTERILLGTGIVLIAQRNPVVLAKEIASLDVVSGGRVLFGIGAGYLPAEFEALGVDFATRGARTDEYVAAMQALWNQPKPAYQGRFVRFSGIDARPRPIQSGGPPIHVGGMSPAGLRRAVRIGHGWYGFAMDVDSTRSAIAALAEATEALGRDPALGRLEISVTPRVALDDATLEAFAGMGVDRVVSLLPNRDVDGMLHFIETEGARWIERFGSA